jgi:SAM-dependent methyltransferase
MTTRRDNIAKILNYYNDKKNFAKYTAGSWIELEFKLLLDPRGSAPHFVKRPSLAASIQIARQLFQKFREGTAQVEVHQTINFNQNAPRAKLAHGSQGTAHSSLSIAHGSLGAAHGSLGAAHGSLGAAHGSLGAAHQTHIKELHFVEGVQIKEKMRCYTKTRLQSPEFIQCGGSTLKSAISAEIPREKIDQFDFVRFKFRFSFTGSASGRASPWRIDFTLVKEYNGSDLNVIKQIKEKFFILRIDASTLLDSSNEWIWTYADRIEIEFEAIESTISATDVTGISLLIQEEKSECLLDKICSVIKLSNSASSANTLKKMLPNAIEINKRQYYDEILLCIDNYYLTDKADGVRAILALEFRRDDHASVQMCTSWYTSAEHSAPEVPAQTDRFAHLPAAHSEQFIVECEYINGKFYAYDVLVYANVNLTLLSFSHRLEYLQRLGDIWPEFLFVKYFVKLTGDNYSDKIRAMHAGHLAPNAKDYEVDGLIFTSSQEPYASTRHYKWKPIEKMTIDFMVKKCPKILLGKAPYVVKPGKCLYLLFSGINTAQIKNFSMKHIRHYKELFPRATGDYRPIQFSPSDNPLAYLYWHPCGDLTAEDEKDQGSGLADELDGEIAELTYCGGEWRLVRIRHDRADDLAKQGYFGNNYKVAEITWRNYINPLTLELICAPKTHFDSGFYFVDAGYQTHTALRKFHNIVKYNILAKHAAGVEWLVDLGCGKGQDLLKYRKLHITNVLFVDSNENNLCELISRKHGLKLEAARSGTAIYVKKMDLCRPWGENLEELATSIIPLRGSANVVVCNFAIHYIVHNKQSIENLARLVKNLLAPGGKFIFTCLDGSAVFDALRDVRAQSTVTPGPRAQSTVTPGPRAQSTVTPGPRAQSTVTPDLFWGDQRNYCIRASSAMPSFTGIDQHIDILLPFSDGQMYREALVNMALLERIFTKNKFVKTAQDSFGLFLPLFVRDYPDQLSELDLQYTKMHKYAVYTLG